MLHLSRYQYHSEQPFGLVVFNIMIKLTIIIAVWFHTIVSCEWFKGNLV